MPIPFKLLDKSPLIGPISQAINELHKGKGWVVINGDWIKHHGFKFKNYLEFEVAFLIELRKSVRKRFIEQKKTDEFAITCDNRIIKYIMISLENLGTSIKVTSPET